MGIPGCVDQMISCDLILFRVPFKVLNKFKCILSFFPFDQVELSFSFFALFAFFLFSLILCDPSLSLKSHCFATRKEQSIEWTSVPGLITTNKKFPIARSASVSHSIQSMVPWKQTNLKSNAPKLLLNCLGSGGHHFPLFLPTTFSSFCSVHCSSLFIIAAAPLPNQP